MRQQNGLEQISFEPVKKSDKKTPKTWDGRFKNSYLKGMEREERIEVKSDWENVFRKFKEALDKKAQDIYHELKYGNGNKDSKLALKDSESIFKQVFTEFMKFSVEDLKDIMESDERLQSLKEGGGNFSQAKLDKIESAERGLKNKKVEAEEIVRTLIPGFYELEQAKQEDLLDDMYREIKEESRFVKHFRDKKVN